MLPPVVQAGRPDRRRDLRAVPQPEGARAQPGHQALGRRAADAGDRPHPAHRRQAAAAGRADRGLAPVIVQQIGAHHPRAARQRGFTILLVEQNFRFAATVADRHYVVEHGRVIDMVPNADAGRPAWTSCTTISASDDRASIEHEQEESMTMTDATDLLRLPRPRSALAARLPGAAPGAGRRRHQDRRAERPVRPLLATSPARARSCACAQGGRRTSARPSGIEDRGRRRPTTRTSPMSAPTSPGSGIDRDGVDVILDVPTSSVALAVNDVAQGEEQGLPQLRRRHLRPDRHGLHAQHRPLDLRHLHAGQVHRRRHGARRAATAGSSSPPTTPSAMRWSATPPTSCTGAAARCSAQVRTPFPGTTDFSSFLLQAQASRAKVIGLANAGADTINCIKQAAEFGIDAARHEARRAADVHHRRACARPADGAGPGLTETFYWDLNDRTRAFTKRVAPDS